MCGITGFIDFAGHDSQQARARVERMADAIVHRGPDAGGYYTDEYAALGHRRLAIIDLSSGQQPMSVLNGAVQIVFNGEIYNYREVRAELEQAGCAFQTKSDTEVILWAYVHWGEACVERLAGMFAFAIWDRRSRRLVLARDRVGKKPLYYYRRGSIVAFASELKALRAANLCPDELDPEALDCYLSYGYIPAPKTIYKHVRKLKAARVAVFTATGESERPYWQLSFAHTRQRSLDEAIEEFEPLMDDAVRCRLVSEVPLGAFLSGGIDSSLVVASMARLMNQPVKTNSIGFDDSDFSEIGVAQEISRHLRTEHREFVVQPRAADVIEKIAWHCDEPLADSSAVPTWYVCQMARESVTVALSGDGGDESFGGYTFRYVPHMMEAKLRAKIPVWARAPLFGLLGAAWPGSARLPKPLRLKTILENLAVGDAEAYYRDLIWMRADTRQGLYSSDFLRTLNGFTPMEMVRPYYSHPGSPDALSRSQLADIHFYMTDDVLVKVDRMSMAHSLEVRSPLLDHRIIEFAASLPADLKIRSGQGKVLLRAAAARRLPERIQKMPKRGFSIPAAKWLRTDLRTIAEELLFDSNRSFAPLLERKAITTLWQEHLSMARDHSVLLWGLMMLGLWDRTRRLPAA